MRLGDLDALKAFLKEYWQWLDDGDYADGFFDAIELLEKAPTIDAVPVVELRKMLSYLEKMCRGGDEGETYTTGYRNGHHNGQIELLRYILQVPDGTSEDERKGGEG